VPLYDYDCASCGERFEVLRGVHDAAPSSCLLCGGGPLKKAFATPAIHFKGSGWAKKERRASSSSSHGSTRATGDGAATGKGGGSSESAGDAGTKARDGAASSSGDPSASPAPAKVPTSSTSSDGSSVPASKAD